MKIEVYANCCINDIYDLTDVFNNAEITNQAIDDYVYQEIIGNFLEWNWRLIEEDKDE